jgi:ABC-type lipoprotein release transport system permease subunit
VVDRRLLVEDLGRPHAASTIFVHLDDHTRARAEVAAIEQAIPEVVARAWVDDSQFLMSALAGSSAVRFVSGAMVVLAVSSRSGRCSTSTCCIAGGRSRSASRSGFAG